MLRILIVMLGLLVISQSVYGFPVLTKKKPTFEKELKTENTTESWSFVSSKVLETPHHLLIGRCLSTDEILHGENIVLNNDGKSQASATIRMNVEGIVNITCVKILDQDPEGQGGYPSFVGGGVGYNYIIFNITTNYGKGFNYYVQINGNSLNEDSDESESEEYQLTSFS